MIEFNKILHLGIAVIFATLLNSCLQSAYDHKSLEYLDDTIPVDVGPIEFEVSSGSDMLVVTLTSGGTFKTQSDLLNTYFVLQKDSDPVFYPSYVPQRDSENQVSVEVSGLSGTYTLVIQAAALESAAQHLGVQAAKSGGWTNVDASIFGNAKINSITYGNGRFAAVCQGGEIASSTDGGVTWNVIQKGSAGTMTKFFASVNGIAYGNNAFYAVGDRSPGVQSPRMGMSEFAISWNSWDESLAANADLNCLAYGGNAFVAGSSNGTILYLWNSGNWAKATDSGFSGDSIRDIVCGTVSGSDYYVAVGDNGRLTTSTNLANWIQKTSAFNSTNINAVAFGNGKFVAVGSDGKISSSNDGSTWTSRNSSLSTGITDVVTGGGKFLAVGHNGKMIVSTDGESWTPETSPYTNLEEIVTVAHGGGKFITAGINYDTGAQRIFYSYQKPVPITPPDPIVDITSTAFTSNVGDNKLIITLVGGKFKMGGLALDQFELNPGTNGYASLNGATIVRSNDTTVTLRGLTAVTTNGSGQTITVKAGAIAEQPSSITVASSKVTTWTKATGTEIIFGTSNINALAFGNSTYVAVGDDKKVAVSADGINWTAATDTSAFYSSGDDNVVDIKGIAYGNSKFVAVGFWHKQSNDSGWKFIASSSDGNTWTSYNLDSNLGNRPNELYTVVYANNEFIVGGMGGKTAKFADAGSTWADITAIPAGGDSNTVDVRGIAYGSSTHIAVGYWHPNPNGWKYIAASTSPINWAEVLNLDFLGSSPNELYCATFGNSKFVIGGAGGKIATSSNGTTWTLATDTGFSSEVLGITYGNSKFIAVGGGSRIGESTDGISWDTATISGYGSINFSSVAFGSSKFVAAGGNKILYSN
ncbi:MAG: hypothetical protein Ta2B_20970 [Termitinemataceae bacterium]|nr:MAG: hypothetical protein Ta2B_20970 [Termitinemataceae bacterium]